MATARLLTRGRCDSQCIYNRGGPRILDSITSIILILPSSKEADYNDDASLPFAFHPSRDEKHNFIGFPSSSFRIYSPRISSSINLPLRLYFLDASRESIKRWRYGLYAGYIPRLAFPLWRWCGGKKSGTRYFTSSRLLFIHTPRKSRFALWYQRHIAYDIRYGIECSPHITSWLRNDMGLTDFLWRCNRHNQIKSLWYIVVICHNDLLYDED